MPAPNLSALSNATIDTVVGYPTTTEEDLVPAVDADTSVEVKAVNVSNISATSAAQYTLLLYRANGSPTNVIRMPFQRTIGTHTTVNVLQSVIYLAEGDSLRHYASANDRFEVAVPVVRYT